MALVPPLSVPALPRSLRSLMRTTVSPSAKTEPLESLTMRGPSAAGAPSPRSAAVFSHSCPQVAHSQIVACEMISVIVHSGQAGEGRDMKRRYRAKVQMCKGEWQEAEARGVSAKVKPELGLGPGLGLVRREIHRFGWQVAASGCGWRRMIGTFPA